MTSSQYDVVVVGAGCAGLTAALALVRAGFAVAVVEAADGAGNPSGGVYFAEHLAHPDVLGVQGVTALPWERRLVERGRFATDGGTLLGLTYRDREAFRHCYTVLRPALDRSLEEAAVRHGARRITGTRVESLIRAGGRVVGVCTPRGPVYADLVFLAEGDVAHLVTREGCERSADVRDAPRFLLGLQRVVTLPPGAIEERFHVGADDGVAYDFLLRNGRVDGRDVPLNARGFLCTNRQGLTLGLVVSTENLRRHFSGNPAALLDGLAAMPALEPWLRDGRPVGTTARLLRGGGARDVPNVVADGLAVGGAAAALGVTFPFLNFTGPATASGLLLAQAAARIRAEGGDFSRQALERHYAEPLTQTHYWQDLEYLRRWPGFVRKTTALFGRDLDLALGTARVWTRPRQWLPGKAVRWLRLLGQSGGWALWRELKDDLEAPGQALQWRRVAGRPALGRLLLDGALNALRDLGGRPRPDVPPAGRLEVHYRSGAAEGDGAPPRLVRRWLQRFRPVLAAAVAAVARNDHRPLSEKLTRSVQLLVRQINLLDLLVLASGGVLLALAGALAGLVRRPRRRLPEKGAGTLTAAAPEPQKGPGPSLPLPQLYLLWPRTLPEDDSLAREGLDHVCPAGVFEVLRPAQAPAEVCVYPQRCMACEACWRASRLVDWDRPRWPGAREPLPAPPRAADPWARAALPAGLAATVDFAKLLDRLEDKLDAFETALEYGPLTIDRARADHLEMLARYAQQQAVEFARLLKEGLPGSPDPAGRDLLRLAEELVSRAQARTRRTWDGRFTWAAADGRQLRRHYLVGLRRSLSLACSPRPRSLAPLGNEGLQARSASEGQPPGPDGAAGAEIEARSASEGQRPALAGAAGLQPAAVESRGEVGSTARLVGQLCRDLLAQVVRDTAAARPGADALRLLLAGAAAAAALLRALEAAPPAGLSRAEASLRAALLQALAGETLDTLLHATAGLGPVAEDFRHAAARLLAAAPAGAYRRYARRLIDGWQKARTLLRVEGDFAGLLQRQALLPEYEEVQRSEGRLARLAESWEAVPEAGEGEAPFDAEIAEEIGRQEARLAACRQVLLQTHAHLEARPDAAVAMALLRVVLDDAAADLDGLAALVQRRLEPAIAFRQRPLVEPGFEPPPATVPEYLAGPEPYQSGDFLLLPVDLVRPRLTPEMLGGQPWPPAGSEAAALREVVDRLSGLLQLCQAARPRQRRSEAEVRRAHAAAWRAHRLEEDLFVAEALACAAAGAVLHPRAAAVDLETACARFVAARLLRHADRLVPKPPAAGGGTAFARERVVVLDQLRALLIDRCPAGLPRPAPRHLGPEALELEALKAEVRRQVETIMELLSGKQAPDLGLRLLGFALAGAVAWLWAAESALGRLAWMGRARLAQMPDDPDPLPPVGRRAFAQCLLEVRTRVERLEEDLAALRRGYAPPQARAAALLVAEAAGLPAPEKRP
jgi:electron transfer flavoprotein-quinone oxidoreductase